MWLFEIPWTAARLAPLSFTISQNLLKLVFIVSIMPSNHLILCCPLLVPSIFPSIRVFPMSWLFASGGQNIRASASASVLLMNVQGWFPLGLTGLIPLQSKGLLRIFSALQFKSINAYCMWKISCCHYKVKAHHCIFWKGSGTGALLGAGTK